MLFCWWRTWNISIVSGDNCDRRSVSVSLLDEQTLSQGTDDACKAILECWDGARAVWWLKTMAKTIIGVKAHFLRMLVPNSPLKYLSGPQRMYFQVPEYILHIAISPVKAVLTYKVPWTEPVLLVFDLNATAIARRVDYSEHTAHWGGAPIQMTSFEASIKVQPHCRQFPAIPSHTLPHLKAP